MSEYAHNGDDDRISNERVNPSERLTVDDLIDETFTRNTDVEVQLENS